MKKDDNKIVNFIKELVPYVVIIVVVILIRMFIITPIRVDGPSMNKTLYNGELLLLYKLGNVKRYDIIVLNEKKDDEIIIKRVIGLPGEKVAIKDSKIYINGEKIDDPKAYGQTTNYDEITLADDEYFILGDNRLVSKDSRIFGPIKKGDIVGKAIFRLFPINRIGTI